MKFECSSEEDRCDKWIARMKSCRQCVFEVLCKFNPYYKKTNDNRQNKENALWDLHKSDGLPTSS